jgi:5'-deoxynucleotidase YfbR-like HD superfamily hydrolase
VQKKNITKKFDGMYRFVAEAYQGNWQYRFRKNPFMVAARKAKRSESVHGHAWACMEFWFHLQRICPALRRHVNALVVYELLLNHDLGEVYNGDVSIHTVVQGKPHNKEGERSALKRLVEPLASDVRREIVANFDAFETPIARAAEVEVLVAKLIDALEGNHFAFVFGKDFSRHEQLIIGIMRIRFIPYMRRLIQVLEEMDAQEAAEEMRTLARRHFTQLQKAGINLDPADTAV